MDCLLRFCHLRLEAGPKISDDTSRYIPEIMSWKQAISNSDKYQFMTLYLNIIFLNEQIKLMNESGYEKVVREGKEKAQLFMTGQNKKIILVLLLENRDFDIFLRVMKDCQLILS